MKLLRGIELKGTYKVTFYDKCVEVYDERDNLIYYENSDRFWSKAEYDERGNQIYFKNSDGEFLDKRVKELTIKEIERLLGYKIKIIGEKK